MSYQVLYRKYRPRDFSQVVGQDHIVSVIRRQVESGRIAHAYLFSGPRGIGKTTVARLIAKAVNCTLDLEPGKILIRKIEKERNSNQGVGDLRKPCNFCDSCQAFNSGLSMNLIEIDAASNRGIDDIRELREAVRFSPAEGRYKVYIIDEAHQLTKDAANALLKTLEEPPAHAIFVLATTELDKVPQTIVSRTQHFDFRRPRREVIAKRLLEIAKGEGVTLSPEAAATIAFAAEGSVRDAESLLGKIMAVEDKSISASVVEEILGIPQREALLELFTLIGRKQLKDALELVNRLYQDGYDMEYLAKILISFFREALLIKVSPDSNLMSLSRLVPAEAKAQVG
ncbi:MAG: DNA polymerase III subunit gamma/tau, partial [Patescibacteria group bacterium]